MARSSIVEKRPEFPKRDDCFRPATHLNTGLAATGARGNRVARYSLTFSVTCTRPRADFGKNNPTIQQSKKT